MPLNPPKKESPAKPADPPQSAKCCDCGRRSFFKESLAVIIGGVITLVPAAAGLMVLLDPLRRKAASNTDPIKVTTLAALPDDGVPRKFPVLADKTDAWNKYRNVPIGAVYLRRTTDGKIEALNVVCPHAGCFVDYSSDRNKFVCPCHNSSFALDGKIADPKSPSPRALDALAVEVRNNDEVWVTFENFQAGRPDKVPIA
jgi:menaquinol-cytochrome c reductase iron-sulfur subunit